MSAVQTVERHRLDSLFAPTSVAIVGASERNHYSNLAMRALRGLNYQGIIRLVNQRGAPAYGMESVKCCSDLAEPVETAYLCVPLAGVLDTARDAIAAGVKNLIIVTSGFAELGGEGAEREAELQQMCAQAGVRVLGPNCLGFRNNLAGAALGSIPFAEQPTEPSIALISASGSVATMVMQYGIQQGAGFTHVIATGNEMDVRTADIIDYLAGIDEVKAIALFLESVRDAPAFTAAAERARAAGKPIVVLKMGAAEITAAVAAAHTGALVGDDRVFDAMCDRHAIVRVTTIEELLVTAATLATTGPIARPGLAFVSISGVICEIASDFAASAGVSVPQFSPATCTELGTVLSDLGQMHNPLDLTGAAVRDDSMWLSVPEIIVRDPQIGMTLFNWDIPNVAEPSMPNTLELIGQSVRNLSPRALIVCNTERPVNEYGRAYMARHGQSFVLPGVSHAMKAMGRLAWWSQRVGKALPQPAPPQKVAAAARPTDERQTLQFLANHGVPVIPQRVAHSGDEAVAAARAIGEPVVLKILSSDIQHKSEVGGVALNLNGDAAVRASYDDMLATVAQKAPAAVIEGVLVSPMRTGGIELLVGIARDPLWGLVCAVGLGGFWVEALADTALCLLPASKDDIISALNSLRAIKMLQGYRGIPAADLDAVAEAVVGIGKAAMALGDGLAALEVNPLLVSGRRVEALDALVVWSA